MKIGHFLDNAPGNYSGNYRVCITGVVRLIPRGIMENCPIFITRFLNSAPGN